MSVASTCILQKRVVFSTVTSVCFMFPICSSLFRELCVSKVIRLVIYTISIFITWLLHLQVKENGSEILIIIAWMAQPQLSPERNGLKSLMMKLMWGEVSSEIHTCFISPLSFLFSLFFITLISLMTLRPGRYWSQCCQNSHRKRAAVCYWLQMNSIVLSSVSLLLSLSFRL